MIVPLNMCPQKPPNSVPENMKVEYKLLSDFLTTFPANVPPHGPVGPKAHLKIIVKIQKYLYNSHFN